MQHPPMAGDLCNLALSSQAAILKAQDSWLAPAEVFKLLQAGEASLLSTSPAPPSDLRAGCLVLYKRSECKLFRKDGIAWAMRLKRRTVAESHDRLKVPDRPDLLLSVYYVTSADGALQRRIYWMVHETTSKGPGRQNSCATVHTSTSGVQGQASDSGALREQSEQPSRSGEGSSGKRAREAADAADDGDTTNSVLPGSLFDLVLVHYHVASLTRMLSAVLDPGPSMASLGPTAEADATGDSLETSTPKSKPRGRTRTPTLNLAPGASRVLNPAHARHSCTGLPGDGSAGHQSRPAPTLCLTPLGLRALALQPHSSFQADLEEALHGAPPLYEAPAPLRPVLVSELDTHAAQTGAAVVTGPQGGALHTTPRARRALRRQDCASEGESEGSPSATPPRARPRARVPGPPAVRTPNNISSHMRHGSMRGPEATGHAALRPMRRPLLLGGASDMGLLRDNPGGMSPDMQAVAAEDAGLPSAADLRDTGAHGTAGLAAGQQYGWPCSSMAHGGGVAALSSLQQLDAAAPHMAVLPSPPTWNREQQAGRMPTPAAQWGAAFERSMSLPMADDTAAGPSVTLQRFASERVPHVQMTHAAQAHLETQLEIQRMLAARRSLACSTPGQSNGIGAPAVTCDTPCEGLGQHAPEPVPAASWTSPGSVWSEVAVADMVGDTAVSGCGKGAPVDEGDPAMLLQSLLQSTPLRPRPSWQLPGTPHHTVGVLDAAPSAFASAGPPHQQYHSNTDASRREGWGDLRSGAPASVVHRMVRHVPNTLGIPYDMLDTSAAAARYSTLQQPQHMLQFSRPPEVPSLLRVGATLPRLIAQGQAQLSPHHATGHVQQQYAEWSTPNAAMPGHWNDAHGPGAAGGARTASPPPSSAARMAAFSGSSYHLTEQWQQQQFQGHQQQPMHSGLQESETELRMRLQGASNNSILQAAPQQLPHQMNTLARPGAAPTIDSRSPGWGHAGFVPASQEEVEDAALRAAVQRHLDAAEQLMRGIKLQPPDLSCQLPSTVTSLRARMRSVSLAAPQPGPITRTTHDSSMLKQ